MRGVKLVCTQEQYWQMRAVHGKCRLTVRMKGGLAFSLEGVEKVRESKCTRRGESDRKRRMRTQGIEVCEEQKNSSAITWQYVKIKDKDTVPYAVLLSVVG